MIPSRYHRLHLDCSEAAAGKTSSPHWSVSFVIVMFAALSPLAAADQISPTVDPPRLFVEVGTESNHISCTYLNQDDPQDIASAFLWVDRNQEPLNTSDSLRIFYNSKTGTLTLNEAQMNDTGDYTCLVLFDNGTCSQDDWSECPNATLFYNVYIMPDYTTDGIVIGVINGVLLIIFVLCLIRSVLADRRRLRKYGQKM